MFRNVGRFIVFIMGLSLALVTGFVLLNMPQKAQADIPDSYKVGNWCWEGGEWGDGRCNAPETEAERDWMWDTGYYLGQYYLDILTCEDIPVYVQIMVGCRYGGGEAGAIQQIQTENGAVTIQAAVDACGGVTWVVVFTGSPSGATPNQTWASNNFTVASDSACPTNSHEIHGNNNRNVIVGGTGNDTIWGYGGNDTLSGGDGDDVLNGGDESCSRIPCNAARTMGDTLNGDAGNDILNGGNESCNASYCNVSGTMGDTLNGGTGADTLNGGNESCSGFLCNSNGTMGDTLNAGGAGNSDGDPDVLNGGGGTDTCNSTAGEGDTQTSCP